MMIFAVVTAEAQIDNRLHWYDGFITYTVTHLDHNNVLMEAMDEGEEHEFILRYDREVNPNHQLYTTMNGPHDYVNEYGVGKTVRHQKSEGWDVICFYDSENRLKSVMSGEKQWDAQDLNKARWLHQMIGEYASEEENDFEKCLIWSKESLSINQIIYPYEIITFNGRVTGFITVKPVDGALNELEGTWEVVPTLQGIKLYSVNTETGSMPWEWKRDGKVYVFAESNPDVGRFFYASTTLLNDKWFRRFDTPTLRIMRNAILARHGYCFQSKDLQDYFNNEPWYKPAASNKSIHLSFVEQLNIDLIKQRKQRELRAVNKGLIAACDDDAIFGGFAADHVGARGLLVSERHAADGGLCLFLDLCFGLGSAVPVAEEETAVLDTLLEFLVVVALVDAFVAILAGFFENVLLDFVQKTFHILCDALDRAGFLFQCVAAHHFDGAVLQVACTQHETYGNTLQLVVGKLETGTFVVGIVELDTDAFRT